MKTMLMLAIGAGLMSQAMPAHAIVAFPAIRTQIRNEAKAEGKLKNLVRPSIRVQVKGNVATAQILSMGKQWPTLKNTRMVQSTAKFKLQSLPDGKLAKPVKQNGQVWQTMYHLD